MRKYLLFMILPVLAGCKTKPDTMVTRPDNPFLTELNEPIPYGISTHEDIEAYAGYVLTWSEEKLRHIRSGPASDFESIFTAFDEAYSEVSKAANNCFMLYWVSPDSLSRENGLKGYQRLDSLGTSIFSDSALYARMLSFKGSEAYSGLTGHRKLYVDDLMRLFEHAGVKLEQESLERFKALKAEITELSARYSTNMNTANEMLVLDEAGVEGLPENFKESYRVSDSRYEIPVIPATRRPVLNNAGREATRELFLRKYLNRAWEENLPILDEMVRKRYELAKLMGYGSYASYAISLKMARDPGTVWDFLNDLTEQTGEKARRDHRLLQQQRDGEVPAMGSAPLKPWDVGFYRDQLLKEQYEVDQEYIREFLPMESCLNGMFLIYQELLGLEFRKIDDASVWHEEVLMYEVWDGDLLKGRFYLDLYPRPNKESWFYGVDLTQGRMTREGQEIPVCLLLGNFPRPTETFPSLLSHAELGTLFHEFGHIMDNMAYHGEFAFQSESKEDFGEAMAQLFENWLWDYDMLGSFARHYMTGEPLPRDVFDRMLKAKNITSGLDAQNSLRNSLYDMMLYDAYDPADPTPTDEIWRQLDRRMAIPMHVEGTHPQGSWIHINTHPTYYYGYLWAEVYAQDMFTVFKEKGLTDRETGRRYMELILANGTQRDIVEAVEAFLGRPSNNEAYIKNLGLDQ